MEDLCFFLQDVVLIECMLGKVQPPWGVVLQKAQKEKAQNKSWSDRNTDRQM